MGLFDRKKAQALAAPRCIPIGPWLQEATARYPQFDAQHLINASMQRVQYSDLLDSAITYVGGKDSYSITEMIVGSVPSDLSVRQHGDHVLFSLGNYGLVKRKYHQATDWTLAVTPAATGDEATVQLIETQMVSGGLENKKIYGRVLDAIADVLQHGVAIEPHPLPAAGLASSAFDTVSFASQQAVNLSLSESVRVNNRDVGATLLRLLGEVIGPRQQSRFEGSGDWPILVETDSGYEFSTSNSAAIRWFAHVLYNHYRELTGERKAVVLEILNALQAAVKTTLTVPPEDQSLPQIASDSKLLPFSISFGSDSSAPLLADQLSASATPRGWHWHTSRLPTKKLIPLVARPSRVQRDGPQTLGYGLHAASTGAVCNDFKQVGQEIRPPEWETIWVDGKADGDNYATVALTGLTHQTGDGIRGSEALLELIDAIADYVDRHQTLQETDPTMLVINRRKAWS